MAKGLRGDLKEGVIMKFSKLASALLMAAAVIPAAHAAIPRFSQPNGNNIVFVANGNIWTVPNTGGQATRLTSAQGQDMFPRVSPDGKWIAYTQASNTGTDIWVIPADGGAAKRLTFHPTVEGGTGGRHGPDNMVVTWTPDSRYVVYLSKRNQWNGWIQDMFKVPVAGGNPIKMEIDSAVGLATFSPDGKSIAYNRIFRNFRTWKRYNGGLAQDVYTYNFDTQKLNRITTWSGTDTSPMWVGDKIYYLSDRDENRRANIWVRDLKTGKDHEVTHFTDYDVDFPAFGSNAISFQQGGKLWELNLADESLFQVNVQLPDDNPRTREHVVAVAGQVRYGDPAGQVDYSLAPNGKRIVISARGDIFSVPAEHGPTRNLTKSQGADDDHPAFSPDGKSVAYISDASGEDQLYTRPAKGGAARKLTNFKTGYFYGPLWGPKSKQITIYGQHKLWLVNVGGGAPVEVALDKGGEIHDQSFSPDGKWLSFSMTVAGTDRRDLYLYNIASKTLTNVDDGKNIDMNPVWSSDGKYLYFASARHENMAFPDVDFDFAELKSVGIYGIPLTRDTASPVAPRSDESVDADTADKTDKTGKSKKSKKKSKKDDGVSVKVDLDGFMSRAVAVPVKATGVSSLAANNGKLYYIAQPVNTFEGPLNGETSSLHVFDLKTRKDEVVASGVGSYALSGDGKKILATEQGQFKLMNAAPGAQKSAKPVDLSHMRMVVNPKKEWNEMFENAWRLERDMFFSRKMNGVDWQGVHDKYVKFLPQLGSREDLNYVIGEMIGEMSNSHTYVGGGDDGDTSSAVNPGVLGVDWKVDASGYYQLAKIYKGDNTRAQYRSPLSAPGLNVKAEDYVLAINGQKLKAPTNPDALLQTADISTPVSLTIASSPNGKTHDILVKLIPNELSVRERAWIQHNRDEVSKLSNGRIGYVYLSDMEELGLQQFMRQFYAQTDKEAMVVDDRWNGGGFIAPYALERLRRVLSAMTVNREGGLGTEPTSVVNGPKVMLLNHWSASDGDIFPYLFKQYKLGELIGTRSWGGVRGIRGYWPMMDGGYITIPEEAMYDIKSVWVAENHGIDPDIKVENDPKDLLAGHDKQLETAVNLLMQKIKDKPKGVPVPPAPPLIPAYTPKGIVAPEPETGGQ